MSDPVVPPPLAILLELEGPQPTPLKVAAFLRHYAMIIRKNEHWDIPQTMAAAYESAAIALETYMQAAPVVPAERPQFPETNDEGARVAPSVPCVATAGSTAEPCTGAVTADERMDLGLSIDMLDVDRLREWARLFLTRGPNINNWSSVPSLVGQMQILATNVEKAIKDIGQLRAASAADRGSALTSLVEHWQRQGESELREATDRNMPAAMGMAAIRLHCARELQARLDPAERPTKETK